jgi:enamine deaminase RidA (YjgF/YER057c/UK114 family)
MSATETRLRELGLQLPDPPAPAGNYVRTVTAGELLFTSGHGPKPDPERQFIGKVGTEIDDETARRAARHAMLACLASLRHDLGDLDRIAHVVKLFGMVNSAPGFDRQPRVLDGASDLLVDLFGDRGRPARSAVGVAELPGGMCVEIDMVVALAPGSPAKLP